MYKNAVLLVHVYQAMDSTCTKQCLTCVCLSGHVCHMYKTRFTCECLSGHECSIYKDTLLVKIYQDMNAAYIKLPALCLFISTRMLYA